MPTSRFKPLSLGLGLLAASVQAHRPPQDPQEFATTLASEAVVPPANGGIFQPGYYAPLTSGPHASRIGDLVTINLVESTNAFKTNSATMARTGSLSLAVPAMGTLPLSSPNGLAISGNHNFQGQGNAAQSNALTGSITVAIAKIYANGTFLVRGEKHITINRGDETIEISGLIRAADLDASNQIESTRVANAVIKYFGKGEIARASKQGWLQRFFSAISPF
ncbi:MAG: flagellar basal body L-ring protein FlgH [Alphaproteobacteria bacterium]|nr:flagellar basal body L-ring protein FlgH [Alphaproteobacteria bacterium]MDE2341311.1 flagellar basal body L-ring protein FlgH [Alphaproteobacteria bacterium]